MSISPKQILQRIQDLGSVDARTLEKIQRHLDDPTKKVSLKAIVRYLVEKELISPSEASRLLDPNAGADVVSAGRPGGKRPVEAYNTDDLIAGAAPLPAPPDKPARKPNRDVDPRATAIHTPVPAGQDYKQDFTMQANPLGVDPTLLGDIDYGAPGGADFDEPTREPKRDRRSFTGKIEKANQWESRWLFVGAGLVMVLVMSTIGLAWLLNRTTADQAKKKAEEEFGNRNYQAARETWETFVRDYPQDKDVPYALARIVQCKMRTFYDAKNYVETLQVAQNDLPTLVEREDNGIGEIQGDLAVMLPVTALSFSEAALKTEVTAEKEKFVQLGSDCEQLITNSAYVPSAFLTRDGLTAQTMATYLANVEKVRFEIARENNYTAALGEIQRLTESLETDKAAQVYYDLIKKYPLLRARMPLAEAIARVSEKERELIKPDALELPVATSAPPPKTLANAALVNVVGNPLTDLQGKVVTYLVNGVLYGLSADTGSILWWRPIGVTTRIPPLWVDRPFQSDLIVCDQVTHRIARIRSNDGGLVWQIEVQEPFERPALVAERGKLFVTTAAGKLIRCDLNSGATEMACQLPQGVTVGPVPHPEVGLLYQLGSHTNLYLISQEDLSCREVFFLGHQPNSLDVEPFFLSGNLCVLENFGAFSQAYVLSFKNGGAEVEMAQQPKKMTDGKVTLDPIRYGRSVIVASDTGDMQRYELNITDDGEQRTVSLDSLIKTNFDTHPGLINYVAAGGGDLIVANRGLTRYRIKSAAQEFEIRKTANSADIFVGPVYVFDTALVHLRRRVGSRVVTAAAVDPETLTELWQCDFEAAPIESPFPMGDRVLVGSSQGDLFELTAANLENVSLPPLVRGTTVSQNLKFDFGIPLENGDRVYCGLGDSDRILNYPARDMMNNRLSLVAAPANRIGAEPIGFQNTLLVPCSAGLICRVDPNTGGVIGAPFQPPSNPNQPFQWVSPTVVGEGKFLAGTTRGSLFLVRAEGNSSLVKEAELEYPAQLVSPLRAIGSTAYAVCRDAARDKLVAFNTEGTISERKTQSLPGEFGGELICLNDAILVPAADGNLHCYDPELNLRWSFPLPQNAGLAAKLAGSVARLDDSYLVAFESGDVVRLDAATGEVRGATQLELPLAGPPAVLGGVWFVLDQHGIVHTMSPLE